ncbi:MAG TPA: HAD family phosphatase, partial [Stellaceae bacterium]|nr:HAD family phosphatase [Stellaceae bacterium]
MANARRHRYGLAAMYALSTRQRSIVVFDLGGVLIDWNPRHLYRKLIADEAAMEHFLGTVCTQAWNERQDAGRTFSEAAALLRAQHPHHAELIDAYGARFDEMMKGPIEGSVIILETLHRHGVPLFALSNWSRETFPLAQRRFEFLKLFRGMVISGEVGVIKPDPRIFEHLMERFGIARGDAVYVDDNPRNAAAATALGLHG